MIPCQSAPWQRTSRDHHGSAGDSGAALVPLEIAQIYRHYRVPSKALSRVRQALEKAPDNELHPLH